MSKERARRREAREREGAIRAAARAAERERRERRAARRRALTPRLPRTLRPRWTPGALAHRRRVRRSLVLALLLVANVVVWTVSPEWAARLGALVVSLLLAPMLLSLSSRA